MSDTEIQYLESDSSDVDTPLEVAISENPEEVARFLENLGLVNELLDAVSLGTSAMDDEMATSLARTGSSLMESADAMATQETTKLAESVGENGEELAEALETLVELQKTGTLDELVEFADAASLLTHAMDDEMVTSIARTGNSLGELVDTASDEDTVRGLETLLNSVGDASDPDNPPKKVGIIGLLRAIRDPEVQRGLGFVIAISSSIGKQMEENEG